LFLIGVWQKKTSTKKDGVAIFWKTQRFALAARDHVRTKSSHLYARLLDFLLSHQHFVP
jgi:hypothetical protein